MTAPLIPKIDLRSSDAMPLDTDIIMSDMWLHAQGDQTIGFAAVNLMIRSWHQVPAASVPADDFLLARLAVVSDEAWSRIREIVLSDWTLCDDGRYYHADVAARALKADDAMARAAANSARQAEKGRKSAEARRLNPVTRTKKSVAAAIEMPTVDKVVTRPGEGAKCQLDLTATACDARYESQSARKTEVILPSAEEPAPPVNQEPKQASKKDLTALVKEVFDYWVNVMRMDQKRTRLTSERRKRIEAALKSYPIGDIKLAIDGCSMNEWNMGKSGTTYNDIELICRNGTYVERFRNEAIAKTSAAALPGAKLPDAAEKTLEAMKRRREMRRHGHRGDADDTGELQ